MLPLAIDNPLQPLIDFFEAILQFFHDVVGFGWGFSIVALTVVVRAALLPLTLKQFKSMQALAKHQPELKRLQQKYKNDKQRLQQETMKFYRENKVNPLASCLPLLAQMPVFLALFYMLQADLKLDICRENLEAAGRATGDALKETSCADVVPATFNEHEFLFITDLTDKATGGVLAALIILYIGSQLLSTLLMQTTADRNQRLIFMALPFIFVLFIINFPTGLIVYWITTNLWTIVQQLIVRRLLGPLRAPTADEKEGGSEDEAETPPTKGGKGGPPPAKSRPPAPKAATSGVALAAEGPSGSRPKSRTGPPPPSPRKKKKRSGRRR